MKSLAFKRYVEKNGKPLNKNIFKNNAIVNSDSQKVNKRNDFYAI